MIRDPLQTLSLHTAFLESIAERFRRDNRLTSGDHVEALELFESLHERVVEANGTSARLGYHIRRLPRGEQYRMRYDSANDSVEACLDLGIYDALEAGEHQANVATMIMIGDLMLRFWNLSLRPRFSLSEINSSRLPEARKLGEALLLPSSGLGLWRTLQPAISAEDLATIYHVPRGVAERRLRFFSEHGETYLAGTAEGVKPGVRLRRPQGTIRRAINALLHRNE